MTNGAGAIMPQQVMHQQAAAKTPPSTETNASEPGACHGVLIEIQHAYKEISQCPAATSMPIMHGALLPICLLCLHP